MKNEMKKILFVINTMGYGGAERALLNLMSALEKEQYEISVFVLTGQGELIHLKAFVKGVHGYFSYYLRRFSLCFCLNNAFQSVLSSQTATMIKKHFDFIICFALLNHKNSIRFVFLRMVILGG